MLCVYCDEIKAPTASKYSCSIISKKGTYIITVRLSEQLASLTIVEPGVGGRGGGGGLLKSSESPNQSKLQ